ncbi:DUF6542 domain-containing protein [Streptomyces sp. NPDC052396]|uniref:DUF6542 domain-containing protein n=1 Tax=Streptomyces sp. NPDC052396 TaxID=3365689 RepID=UPI0037D6D41D
MQPGTPTAGPSPDPAISPPQTRAARRIPGSRGRSSAPAPGGRRARRPERTKSRGRRRAVLVALLLPVAGAVLDELTGSALGTLFALTAALGGALAAAGCSRAGAWWVAYAPPPLVALVTVVADQAAGRTGSHGRGLTTGAVHWAIDAFPAMASAEAAILAVLAVRWFRARRGAPGKRGGPGKSARKGA